MTATARLRPHVFAFGPVLALVVSTAAGGTADRDPADPAALAASILDDARPQDQREALVRDHPGLSAELIRALTADLKAGSKEESRRIPWIWRVAVAAGKRNDAAELRRVLDAALPGPDGPLDDWRAVVVGGGVINGITLAGDWPAERVAAVVAADPALAARWARSLSLAAAKADDESVSTGTRYDALRMLGVLPWDLCGARLFRYLLKGVDAELQQGAVSALGDVRSPSTPQALLSGLAHYTPGNRDFALDALLRDAPRASALLDAVADGRVTRADLGGRRVEALKRFRDEAVRTRAASLFGK